MPGAVLVLAFQGWNDAGDAASGAVVHLERVWQAQPLLELDPDDYYDFQVNRPLVGLDDAGVQRLSWPTTRFSRCRPPGTDRDVILVSGPEPSLRWRRFSDEVLATAAGLDVRLVVSLGALLADNPHTRPVPVTGTTSDPELVAQVGLETSRYEGPTGIVGVLSQAFAAKGLPSVSFWAAVPHYVSQTACPKATIALLRRIEDLLDLPVPLGDLPEQAREWERQVDELAADDEDVAAYIASLEEREPETELPEASGDAIAKEFERFLRRGDDGSDPG